MPNSSRNFAAAFAPERARTAGHVAAALPRLAIRLYRIVFSSVLGANCRFEPSCSRFAEEALGRHGLWRGSRLAIGRVLRCHPWNAGGYDPVP